VVNLLGKRLCVEKDSPFLSTLVEEREKPQAQGVQERERERERDRHKMEFYPLVGCE